MIDSYSMDLYTETIKSFHNAITKFIEFSDYEDKIAEGLTGFSYILICENIPFSYKDGTIMIHNIHVKEKKKEMGLKLMIEEDGITKAEGTPFEIYNWIKKKKD